MSVSNALAILWIALLCSGPLHAEVQARTLPNGMKILVKEDHRAPVAVCIPELVKPSWWERILHAHYSWRLRSALLQRGGSGLIVMTVPGYLREPSPSETGTEAGAAPPRLAEPTAGSPR